MRLIFCGAAQTVTGSQHLVEENGRRLLLDCGLYQGRRDESRKRNAHFHFDPRRLDCVILSHAHMDHAGNLPTLVAAGFRGPIHCTPATAEIARELLRDSAHIQKEDVRFLNKHKRRRGEPEISPLYTEDDVRRAGGLLKPRPYHRPFHLDGGVEVTFLDAGHLLGSALVRIDLDGRAGRPRRRLLFTGDLGRPGLPLLRDPEAVTGIDVLVSESTYGDRVHDQFGDLKERLREVLSRAVERRAKVIIPAFSLGRTQTVVYQMNRLFEEGRLPRLPIFVDSPLATRVTEVYRRHTECLDDQVAQEMKDDDDVFGFDGLTYVGSADESKALNDREGPFVVVAASGMCEAGRVLHHLRHSVEDSRNTILITSYQAPDTLGRRIAEKTPRLRILDDWFDLRAEVQVMEGFSSHADRDELQTWYAATGGAIEHAFLVHGEPQAMEELAPVLQPFVTNPVRMPRLYETVEM